MYTSNTMPVDLVLFKNQIDRQIVTYLEEEMSHYASISNNVTITSLLHHLIILSSGGKRFRPFLVYSLYKHTHPHAKADDIMPLLLAVEIFHVFCLIHDDIMDESPMRHGVATAQEFAYKNYYPNNRRIAESQAILIGDILFNSVFKLLHTFTSKNPTAGDVTSLFHRLIDEVCIGQMLDVDLTTKERASEKDIVEKNRLKTARYSIVHPLQLGAIIAGRDDLEGFITAFGEQIGLLYQTQDDLIDIVVDISKTQKPRFQDVVQNQHTVLRAFIEEQDGNFKDQLHEYLGKPISETDVTNLEKLFVDSGAITYAEHCISEYKNKAETLINEELYKEADKELFKDIMTAIIKRTH